jgi:hypothetical protein
VWLETACWDSAADGAWMHGYLMRSDLMHSDLMHSDMMHGDLMRSVQPVLVRLD